MRWRSGYAGSNDIGDDEPAVAAGDVALGGTAVAVTAGSAHTCALLASGTVRCWGLGAYGALGYGNTLSIGEVQGPAAAGDVPLGAVPRAIAAGGFHTCALLDSGATRCWGYGRTGALGYGNMNRIGDDETPLAAGDVPTGATLIQITAGDSHTCALTASGRVRCWGDNTFAQLGQPAIERIGTSETPADFGGFAEVRVVH